MRPSSRALAAAGIATLTATLLAGCDLGDKITEPYQDAPRTGHINSNGADIITNPDGFSNVATKCDHGNRLYVAFHSNSPYAGIAVVAQDPTCKGQ